MKAIIAGATGLVGSLLIQKLLGSSQLIEVVSVSRRPLQIQNPKLRQVIIQDFSQLTEKHSLLKGDLYFCCLGTTIKEAGSQENFRKVDFIAILEFGKLAKVHDAKSFVLISAMGANPNSSIFYNRVKGETEEALKALNLKSLSIFRPGLLIGKRTQARAGEQLAISLFQALSPALPNRWERLIATKVDVLASRMLEAGLAANPGVEIIPSVDINRNS